MTGFIENQPLLGFNTFGLEASARYWATFSSAEELRPLVQACRDRNLPWYVLGGGSNLILTGNFPGAILHPVPPPAAFDPVRRLESVGESVLVEAAAGMEWDDFVAWTVEQGLGGVENLSLIPGQVGAAPVQNIGAYGVEAKDAIAWVDYLDTETLTAERIAAPDCGFGYRDSIFKRNLKGRAIITGVAFRLSNSPSYNIGYGDLKNEVDALGGPSLENVRAAVTSIRRQKLPDPTETGNAGSFFKNPVVPRQQADELRTKYPDMPSYDTPEGVKIPAGWLIDRAGWKGFRAGTVGVHPKQALVIVNLGGATANEILTLAGRIIADIQNRFGITLSMEVNVL